MRPAAGLTLALLALAPVDAEAAGGARSFSEGLLHPLFRQFDGYRSQADLLLAEGDRVVVQARGTAKTTRGASYNQTYCYIFRVADGRISEVIEYCDTALVERVLDRVGPPSNGRGSAGR